MPRNTQVKGLHLYLISEKSIWRNHVQWTGYLVYISNLSFAAFTACKINVVIDFCKQKIQFVELDFFQLNFSKFKYELTGGESVNKIVEV